MNSIVVPCVKSWSPFPRLLSGRKQSFSRVKFNYDAEAMLAASTAMTIATYAFIISMLSISLSCRLLAYHSLINDDALPSRALPVPSSLSVGLSLTCFKSDTTNMQSNKNDTSLVKFYVDASCVG